MKRLAYFVGAILLIFGIYLSIVNKEPHFYTFFSLGAFIILYNLYNYVSKKPLFDRWNLKKYILFLGFLLIACLIIDYLGMKLGYWTYQYSSLFDNIIKYIFEWGVALLYFMLVLIIGIFVFKKTGKIFSFLLSLIIFVTIVGLATEYFNYYANSWIVLSMPITNFKIGNFFLIFQIIGYWLMAIIPFSIYKCVDKVK